MPGRRWARSSGTWCRPPSRTAGSGRWATDPYVALLEGTGAAASRLLYVLWTDRTFDRFAAFMLVLFAVGLTLSFVSGDARCLLPKDSVPTAVSGAIFGVSWLLGRPLMVTVVQRFGARSEAEREETGRGPDPMARLSDV